MVNVPDRNADPVFALAENPTVPLPEPLAPDVTVSHGVLLLTAVHGHELAVVTATLPVPPPAATDWLVDPIVIEQAADCVTVKVFPAIVSDPIRAVVSVLAATEYATVPLPVPDAPLVSVSHASLLKAVQAHVAVTGTVPVAAPGPTVLPDEVIVEAHVVVSANVFETVLGAEPPGPTAATVAV